MPFLRALTALLSLNRMGFGLAYLLRPASAGEGWIGKIARVPMVQVSMRGLGSRDFALGAGASTVIAVAGAAGLRGDRRDAEPPQLA
jgi:hypothetical protein